MSKINIDRIVRDIKTRTTSLTPIIEAVCNSIEAIGETRTDGKIQIILKRDGSLDFGIEETPVKVILFLLISLIMGKVSLKLTVIPLIRTVVV
jgi:hypothetical protein